jgi:hypothetical protein
LRVGRQRDCAEWAEPHFALIANKTADAETIHWSSDQAVVSHCGAFAAYLSEAICPHDGA